MASKKKHLSLKKPSVRKRRANIMLKFDHEASSFTIVAKKVSFKKISSRNINIAIVATINIFITLISKTLRLRLNITSYRLTISLLRLNKSRLSAE